MRKTIFLPVRLYIPELWPSALKIGQLYFQLQNYFQPFNSSFLKLACVCVIPAIAKIKGDRGIYNFTIRSSYPNFSRYI